MTNPNLPSALYLPTGGFTQADDTAASIELRNTDDGKVALVAFSSLAQLTSCCGKDQPWVLVSTKQLPKLHAARPYDVIVLDTPLPRDLRHTGALV